MTPDKMVEEMAFKAWAEKLEPQWRTKEQWEHPINSIIRKELIIDAMNMLSVVLSHLEEVALSDVFTKVTLKPEYRSWMEKGGAE